MEMECEMCHSARGNVYTVLLRKDTGVVDQLEMPLCQPCCDDLRAEDWIGIERLETPA